MSNMDTAYGMRDLIESKILNRPAINWKVKRAHPRRTIVEQFIDYVSGHTVLVIGAMLAMFFASVGAE